MRQVPPPAIVFSRGAATECSPRPKPWVTERPPPPLSLKPRRGDRVSRVHRAKYSVAPPGLGKAGGKEGWATGPPRLTPWATFCRPSGAENWNQGSLMAQQQQITAPRGTADTL